MDQVTVVFEPLITGLIIGGVLAGAFVVTFLVFVAGIMIGSYVERNPL